MVFGDKYTQSCFIQFEESSILSEMCKLVKGLVHSPEDYNAVPHLSLFYGVLDTKQQDAIRDDFELPKVVNFNLVKAIANPARVASREDVEYWNEWGRRGLGR